MEAVHYTDIYRECMRNHAASLGSYATDGCGEFTLDDTQPGGALTCAACGCHRNFHRKVSRQLIGAGEVAAAAVPAAANSVEMVDYSGGAGGRQESSSGKKRFRTKFTEEQKEKMLEFAEKLGWRLQRKLDHGGHGNGDLEDEDEIERFCRGVGISRKVFKVWMHNHKNSPSPADSVGPATCTSKK